MINNTVLTILYLLFKSNSEGFLFVNPLLLKELLHQRLHPKVPPNTWPPRERANENNCPLPTVARLHSDICANTMRNMQENGDSSQWYSSIWNHSSISFYKVWSQSFKFQFLFNIHNLFSFNLYIVFLRSFQLSFFYSTFIISVSVFGSTVNNCSVVLPWIQVIQRITME